METRVGDDEINRNLIKERNEEIKMLEQDANLLAEMFQDLAILLHSQGEEITVAEENIVESAIAVNEGVSNLKTAAAANKSGLIKAGIWLATSAAIATGGGFIAVFASPVLGLITLSAGCIGTVVSGYNVFRNKPI